jgi:hypothetical protein
MTSSCTVTCWWFLTNGFCLEVHKAKDFIFAGKFDKMLPRWSALPWPFLPSGFDQLGRLREQFCRQVGM